jgi:hypothetical protein
MTHNSHGSTHFQDMESKLTKNENSRELVGSHFVVNLDLFTLFIHQHYLQSKQANNACI